MLKKNFYVVNDGEINKGFNNRKDADCYAYQLARKITIKDIMESADLDDPGDIPEEEIEKRLECAGVDVRTKEEIEEFNED